MFDRSTRFDEAIINGGNIVFRGQITTGVDDFSFGVLLQDVPILSGIVTVDTSAQRRRTLSNCQIPDITGTWSNLNPSNPFSPYRPEFRPYVGFDYGDGTEELLPLGVFRIEDVSATDRGLITISGYDRSLVVAAAKFETPRVITAGTAPEVAIVDIVETAFPGISTDVTATGFTLPLTVLQEGGISGDPWKACTDMAANAGFECFFDQAGTLVIRPIPDASLLQPVWSHEPGEDSIMLSTVNRLSSAGVYNVAVVVGEGPGITTPVRGTAEVTDQASPIYPSPSPGFGRRPIFIKSSQITTTTQALSVAAAYIREQAGAAERTSFSAVPHPAHEGGDVVQIRVPSMGLDVLAVLDQFTLDLTMKNASSYQTKGRRAL